MASITEIEQKVNALAVRIADEFDALRQEFGLGGALTIAWTAVLGKPNIFASDWSLIGSKPTVFPPSAHIHTTAEISDFVTAVNALIAAGGGSPTAGLLFNYPANSGLVALIFEDF